MRLSSELSDAADICHQSIVLSEGFSYGTVCDDLPFSHLLRKNAVFDMLQAAGPIYLSHQTKYVEEISASGVVRRGGGCLASVLYTTPLYGSEGSVHDNFFSLVLSHQSQSEKDAMSELIAVVPNNLNGTLYGMNYLRAGTLLARIAAQSDVIEAGTREKTRLLAGTLVTSSDFQAFNTSHDINDAYKALHNLASNQPFFAHLYYESLAQVVMLSSRDQLTEDLAQKGQFNACSFYDLLFAYGAPEGDRYDTSRFSPDYTGAERMLQRMNDDGKTIISIEDTLRTTLRNMREFIASLSEESALVTQLEGQIYLYSLDRKLSIRLLANFSGVIEAYRQQRGIGLVINTATLKQELGVLTTATSFAVRSIDREMLVDKPYVLESVEI